MIGCVCSRQVDLGCVSLVASVSLDCGVLICLMTSVVTMGPKMCFGCSLSRLFCCKGRVDNLQAFSILELKPEVFYATLFVLFNLYNKKIK